MGCDCGSVSAKTETERRVLRQALMLNGLMFVVGLITGLYGQSISILADATDMAADASGYGLSLLAVRRGSGFREKAAFWTGSALVLLGGLILADTLRHWIDGSEPLGPLMMGYSILSLAVNLYVLSALSRIREGGVHLNASYICTRADVLANLAVLGSGAIIWLTGAAWLDLVTGIGIAWLVFSEAKEIFESAREGSTA